MGLGGKAAVGGLSVHGCASVRRWVTGAPGLSQAVHALVVWAGQLSTEAKLLHTLGRYVELRRIFNE
jgi:hypothetical protein